MIIFLIIFLTILVLFLMSLHLEILDRVSVKDFIVLIKNFSWNSPESRKFLFKFIKGILFKMIFFVILICTFAGAGIAGAGIVATALEFLFSK